MGGNSEDISTAPLIGQILSIVLICLVIILFIYTLVYRNDLMKINKTKKKYHHLQDLIDNNSQKARGDASKILSDLDMNLNEFDQTLSKKGKYTTGNNMSVNIFRAPEVRFSVVYVLKTKTERSKDTIIRLYQYLKSKEEEDPEFSFELILIEDIFKSNLAKSNLYTLEELKATNEFPRLVIIKNSRELGTGISLAKGAMHSVGEFIIYLCFSYPVGLAPIHKFSEIVKTENLQWDKELVISGEIEMRQETPDARYTTLELINFSLYDHALKFAGLNGPCCVHSDIFMLSRAAGRIICPNTTVSSTYSSYQVLAICGYTEIPVSSIKVQLRVDFLNDYQPQFITVGAIMLYWYTITYDIGINKINIYHKH